MSDDKPAPLPIHPIFHGMTMDDAEVIWYFAWTNRKKSLYNVPKKYREFVLLAREVDARERKPKGGIAYRKLNSDEKQDAMWNG